MMATITSRHQVRSEICSLPDYFDTLSSACVAIDDVLRSHGMMLDDTVTFNNGSRDNGRINWPIKVVETGIVCGNCRKEGLENEVILSWYKMPSGKLEITTYIS